MFGWKTKSTAPQRAAEMTGAYNGSNTHAGHGMMAGTNVATAMGWRPVEALTRGDLVLTFDHGMQVIADVRRTVVFSSSASTNAHMLPLHVPAGALGNKADMTLLPEQGVMVESDAAMDMYGDPFAVVPASSLEGFEGIERDGDAKMIEIVTVFFAKPEVIYAEGGTMIYCPPASLSLADMVNPQAQPYELLNTTEAAFLVECMVFEDRDAFVAIDAFSAPQVIAA